MKSTSNKNGSLGLSIPPLCHVAMPSFLSCADLAHVFNHCYNMPDVKENTLDGQNHNLGHWQKPNIYHINWCRI